jgi:hypothetical protein
MLTKRTALALTLISAFLFSEALGAFFVKSTQANPYFVNPEYTEVSPPAGTKPPIVTIHTPQNGSCYPKNLTLTFDVTVPEPNGNKSIYAITELYYKASWHPNEITITQKSIFDSASFSINLTDVRGGDHSITIYAVGFGSYKTGEEFDSESCTMTYYIETFEKTGFSTVSFTKDLVSPRISFLSPPNGTYVTSDVELDFTVSEAASEILYSLDGKENQTVSDSLTLTGLAEGAHNVTLYAADLAGNTATPKTLFFSVDLPEPFPIMPVAAASVATAVVVGVGLLVYFKKRKH